MEKATKSIKKVFKSSVFIFRRDLRLDDNTGLIKALKLSTKVYPVFIFDPRQIHQARNDYFSNKSVQFMCQSLQDLNSQLEEKGSQLNLVYGEYPNIIEEVIEATEAEMICVNEDYTKFSRIRDQQIRTVCMENKVRFVTCEDICLLNKDQALNGREEFYKKFTPFYNAVSGNKVKQPQKCEMDNFAEDAIEQLGNEEEEVGATKKKKGSKTAETGQYQSRVITDFGKQFYTKEKAAVKGGRTEAKKIVAKLSKLKNYEVVRNDPSKSTSKLSAHNKFGTVSIREVYYGAKLKLAEKAEPFIRQLYWRDFYYYIGYFYPHIFEGPMKINYAGIAWWDNDDYLQKWKDGMTGCPIVDASMRDMNTTGYMPNRVRMIVSNFLVKDLHINWQEGEKYFAQKLVDYDPCQNNGGWQWSAGCGVDSQPYFRIFNPKRQSEKFDPQCKYIRKWIPELADVDVKDIHDWEEGHKKAKYKGVDYPKPVVTHADEKETTIQMYVKALEAAKKRGIDTNSYRSLATPSFVEGGQVANVKSGKRSASSKKRSQKVKKSASSKKGATSGKTRKSGTKTRRRSKKITEYMAGGEKDQD